VANIKGWIMWGWGELYVGRRYVHDPDSVRGGGGVKEKKSGQHIRRGLP